MKTLWRTYKHFNIIKHLPKSDSMNQIKQHCKSGCLCWSVFNMSSSTGGFTNLLQDSGYRRNYCNIMKGSAGLEHSKACCEFLKICYENDVIPNSCKVKLKAKPCPSDVIAKLRAQNIREASKKELELAIKTQELVTEDANEKLKRNLNRLS